MRRWLVALLAMCLPMVGEAQSIRVITPECQAYALGNPSIRFACGVAARWDGLLNGLVSYWKLDEVSGTRYDSVGDNDLTDNNTVGSTGDAMDGAAASFVTANSEYLTGNSPFSDVTSFSLWFKTSQSADYPTVFWHNPGDNNPPLGVYFTSSNTLIGRCTTSDNVQNEITVATGANDGNWHHLMGWFDPDDKKGYFSLDGATPVATAAHSVATLRTSGVTALSIGYFLYVLFQGQVDEVAIWDRVLTEDERAELYAAGAGKFYPFP